MDHQITQSSNNRRYKVIALIIVVVTLVIIILRSYQSPSLSLNDIQTEFISNGDLNITAKGFGKFFSRSDEVISSKIAGRVEEVLLYPGDIVSKDQLIIQLSNTDLDYEFLQQKHSLESLKIQWYEDELNLEEQINVIQDDVELLELGLKIKEKTNTSNFKLYKDGIVSEINYLKSESELEIAKLKLKNLNRKITRFQNKQINQKLVNSKKLDLELAKYTNLENKIMHKQIYSTINGVIKQINLNKGDEIKIGNILSVIGSKQPDAAKIEFPQYFLNSLTVGMQVDMAYADETVSAHISRVNPKINDNYVTVEVSLPEKSTQSALIDMNINAEINIRRLTNVFYLHQPSYFNSDDPYLFIIKDNRIIKTKVTADIVGNNYIVIRSGVLEKDHVIISDHKELHNNIELKIND